MQREALPGILETDHNVVASAPTASGKTALAELAICKTLSESGTALFIAPLRALTNEKESEWERFEDLGYSVYVVSGERDLNPAVCRARGRARDDAEKADSATRKHDSGRYSFITDVDCVVIDEVHLLDSEKRGAVLEVTVSRLRRLQDPASSSRSATMPNIADVAEWLDAPAETTYEFGDEYRPVDLETGVKTYSHGSNAFADKYRRLYRALDLAEPHVREDGQALVFVSSRQGHGAGGQEGARRDNGTGHPDRFAGRLRLPQRGEGLTNDTLRQSVTDGVGFHRGAREGGPRPRRRRVVQAGEDQAPLLDVDAGVGVNLPARCVVIRDTKYHDPLEGETDISPLDVLQMLGRAGRPGYDDVGYGWVVCDRADADKYARY